MKFNLNIFLSLLALGLFAFSCSSDELPEPEVVEPPIGSERIIWTGTPTTFTKANGADPTQPENQDRLTDNVWITRGNSGGEIYNAQSENARIKNNSPQGTLWAEGSIDDIDNLTFATFRQAVGKPKNVVGKDLVLFLVADNTYVSVTFTSWTSRRGGGFAYTRSTP